MTDDAHPQRIGIVGLGLIGGSIGLALRDPAREIIGCDVSPRSEKVAVQRFCVDRLAPLDEVAKAEVVFIAVPPGAVIATGEELLKHKAEQTVADRLRQRQDRCLPMGGPQEADPLCAGPSDGGA